MPGDFASVEADGTIVLLGRGSVVINSGGEKIYPEEVEEAVKRAPRGRRLPRRRRARRPLRRSGHRGRLAAPGTEATGEEIGGALEGRSRFKRPRNFVFVPEVVRGPNGKADYKWAKAVAADGVD